MIAYAPHALDFEWPPGSGRWVRPNSTFQCRWMGIWPEDSESIWSEGLWRACLTERPFPTAVTIPRIGCDVARFGSDWTAFHVRWGDCCLYHETYHGQDTMHTVGRLIYLAKKYAPLCNTDPVAEPVKATDVLLIVDSDGMGAGVIDRLRELKYAVRPVGAGSNARAQDEYAEMRSELWFGSRERAREGRIDVSRLDAKSQNLLKAQLMLPRFKHDSQGRRVVEPKDITKKRSGRSPDDADAFNLAWFDYPGFAAGPVEKPKAEHKWQPGGVSRAAGKGYMGR